MILCYSGTGNSRYVAKLLSENLGDSIVTIDNNTSIDDITEACRTDKIHRVIWTFPIYSWGLPEIITELIATLPAGVLPEDNHYMVCTCGDDIGEAHLQWREAITRRGWNPVSAFSVIMPNTYVLLPGFDVDSSQVRDRKLAEAPERVAYIASAIKDGGTSDDVITGTFRRLKSRVIYPFFMRHMTSPKAFCCDKTNCVKCGKCAAVCPMDNVDCSGGYPSWGDNCQLCLACYHSCPRHAVNYGSRTKKKGQYTCPF